MARISRHPLARGLDFSGARRIGSSEAPTLILESLKLDVASGGVNATATGVILTYTASMIAGAASGQQNAMALGAIVAATYSLTPGEASVSSGATASGSTFTASYSVISGGAAGVQNGTASGVTLAAPFSIIPGSASGVSDATATGAALAQSHMLFSGSAMGDQSASAGGATMLQGYSFIPGAASSGQNATADGAVISSAYELLAGIASGGVTISGSRGDDAFRSAGAARKFWEDKAASWMQEALDRAQEASAEPMGARARISGAIVAETQDRLLEWPAFAPQINAIQRVADRLLAPSVDYSEFARYAAQEMQAIEAAHRAMRRKRDLEALLMLAD